MSDPLEFLKGTPDVVQFLVTVPHVYCEIWTYIFLEI